MSLCRAIAASEQVEILVLDEEGRAEARAALPDSAVNIHDLPFGDIWLRDTGPLFCVDDRGALCAAAFRFNGWGGKYMFEHDSDVAAGIARLADCPLAAQGLVLEGGALEFDGAGTFITTRECLLNENRNPGLEQVDVENILRASLGAERVIWLERGLRNDHTDGHADTLARFIEPGRVLCMEPRDEDDPNEDVLREIRSTLEEAEDAEGRRLQVVTVPSPGRVVDGEGSLLPASYLNFYVANSTVIVPVYGCSTDDEAVGRVGECFGGRGVQGLSARAILSGGGAFHCITCQEPVVGAAGSR